MPRTTAETLIRGAATTDAAGLSWASEFADSTPRKRLSWLALLGGVTWVAAFAHGLFAIYAGLPTMGMEDTLLPCAAAAMTLSVATLVATRSPRLPETWVVPLGIAYGWLLVLVPELLFIGVPLPEMPVRAAPFSIIAMLFVPIFLQWGARPTVAWGVLVAPVPALVVLAAPLVGRPAVPLLDAMLWSSGPLFAAPMTVFAAMLFDASRRATERARAVARDLGSYRLDHLLGKGGMGEVWRAEHRLLARPVALKIIRPDGHLDPLRLEALRRRFFEEARATAELESAHTISLFDFGVAPDQSLFYVMELLEGLDLERVIAIGGPMPPARVVHVLRQVMLSLREAHHLGLVHRDIKPANIMLCQVARQWDHVKVLDFGIVRRVESDITGPSATAEGAIVGTPAFMAPEMIQGTQFDHRADLYAAGCVAWFLLCGRYVFEDETPMAVVVKHCTAPPEPPSTWAEVPPGLDALVLRLLAKTPSERPLSADEVISALDALELPVWTQGDALQWWADEGRRQSTGADSKTGERPSETWVFPDR